RRTASPGAGEGGPTPSPPAWSAGMLLDLGADLVDQLPVEPELLDETVLGLGEVSAHLREIFVRGLNDGNAVGLEHLQALFLPRRGIGARLIDDRRPALGDHRLL